MTWIVLLQLGTPDSLDNKSIGRYLREFLMDPRTINIPWLFRFILVNGIIVPLRINKVFKRYAKIWDADKGSPLRFYGDSLAEKLNETLPDAYQVFHAMRFGSPSIESVLDVAKNEFPEKITFIPLFPHETEATTGSIRAEVDRVLSRNQLNPEIRWLPVFKDDKRYLQLMANKLKNKNFTSFDQVLFSFHGLPLKQIEADHKGQTCGQLYCSDLIKENQYNCYTRVCYKTAADIAKEAGLKEENYSIAFQSRFGKRWIGPHSEDVLGNLHQEGKSVLLMAPSFLTDCLETSWEIGISFKEFAEAAGGKFDWITALNDDYDWVKHLHDLLIS